MKKILCVVGTRPNFIKITQFENEFSKYPSQFDFKLIHTGQHYDDEMSNIFFNQLKLKKPDVFFEVKKLPPARQIALIIEKLTDYIIINKPDCIIAVGDV
ncbi:MAG TPA: UDP-N-acetylglucosamine 2-epimerase, partial [Ignavibacteriaceae bacterium]